MAKPDALRHSYESRYIKNQCEVIFYGSEVFFFHINNACNALNMSPKIETEISMGNIFLANLA